MAHSLKDSQYIFEQNQVLSWVLLSAVVLLLLFAIFNTVIIRFEVKNIYTIKFKKIIRNDISMCAIIIAIIFAYPTIRDCQLIKRIKENSGFTVGTTTQWTNQGDLSFNIEYYYIVNGKQFTSQANPVFDGKKIPGIKVPNGHYRVIYNTVSPEESVIDFKIKEELTKMSE